jgi:2-haloacid dehalogenase
MAEGETTLKALVFDVFGTVVDYRSTIMREGAEWNRTKNLTLDWGKFSDAWRGRYMPSMQKVMRGEQAWTKLDDLHRTSLEEVLREFGAEAAFNDEEKRHLNKVWHRLQPWPDAVEGLTRLKQKFIIATLSNGNVGLLTNMAKYSGLPWDLIFSAELVKAYKPDPRAYCQTFEFLDLQPDEVMLVAAHEDDLRAARTQGLRTAFVFRPLEWGPTPAKPAVMPTAEAGFDYLARDFIDLAQQLGI